MDRLNRILETIRRYLGGMTASQKLLLASLAVVMVLALFLVRQYTSSPGMVALLPGAPGEEQTKATRFLQTAGIAHETASNGEVMVPSGRQTTILAQMAESGQMPADNRLLFDSLIDKQSWTKNYEQNAQLETVAVQNELNRIIGKMNGIRSATVIMDVPRSRSIGQPARAPTAAVTVFADRGLDQNSVDAIAHLVASSRAGLSVERVRVIDGKSNRQFRARAEGVLSGSSYQEYQAAVETRKQSQLYEMLSSYIPGVVVTVHAVVDNTVQRKNDVTVKPSGRGSEALVTSEETNRRDDREQRGTGGGPGGGADRGGSCH
ncbi:MAG: hypothetical protein IBJ11_10175, partial [Phycisphaerales bacterium]|nr:hypothetical protein [Phycisphaerales bacterium]